MAANPIDSVTRFIQRPKKTIGKSEYDRSAQQIAIKTLEIHEKIKAVRNEERSSGRSRKIRNELKNLSMELEDIEDEERELQKLYPARRKQSDIVDVHHLGVLVVLILRNFSFYPLRNVDIARRIIHSSQRPGAPVPELDV